MEKIKSYVEITKELELKIDKICKTDIFDNVKYFDEYNRYKELLEYGRALDTSYRHNNIIIEMHITGATKIQNRINKAVAYNCGY